MSEVNLPQSWQNVSLLSITSKIGSGSTPKGGSKIYLKSGTALIRSMNIHFDRIREEGMAFITDEAAEKLDSVTVYTNDVLLNITGASIGRVNIATSIYEGARVNQHVAIIRLCEKGSANFLRYYLSSPEVQNDILTSESGATRQALTKEKIENFLVPFPPLTEQKVIAKKLDTLLAQVDNTKARLERIPEILKRFRQSVLAAAVSGKLTEEWRESNCLNSELDYHEVCLNERLSVLGKKNIKLAKLQEQPSIDLPESWSWQSLDEVNIKITDGTHHSPQSFPNGDYMYVTSKNVREGRIDLGNVTFVDEKTHREIFSRCDVKYGDVLYVKDGANTGLSCVNNITEEFSLLSSVGVLRTCSFMVPTYVQHYLNSPIGRKLMLDLMGGTAIKRLTLTKIAVSPISVPHKKEQTEIVRRIEEFFTFADRIEHAAQAALSRVNNLTQSILAKAFRGELTADWRAANPELISGQNSAEALLAKIKAERAKLKPKKAAK